MNFCCVVQHQARAQRSSFNMRKVFLEQGWRRRNQIRLYTWIEKSGVAKCVSCWSIRDLREDCGSLGIMVVNTIHWFRKGLRLHDNPSLRDSIIGADTLRCVYILDPWFAGSSNVGISRWRRVTFESEHVCAENRGEQTSDPVTLHVFVNNNNKYLNSN